MKSRTANILIVLLMLITVSTYAQNELSVSGKVLNLMNQPINGANVSMTSVADTSLILSAVTDINGNYAFNTVKRGMYKVMATSIGYESVYRNFNVDSATKAANIVLQPSVLALNEVKITASKPLVEQKIDKTVVNVDAMLTASGGTALEVLEKSPGVIIGQNGSITLKGKATTIFIDDKPTYLSGQDLENYLRSLPSASLNQIELMTNPSSRYDAAGNGGVINIRTKKTKIVGINGGINLGYIQGNYARTNNSLNVNYRNNKINISENLSYITTNSYSDLDINRHFQNAMGETTANFLQNSFTRYTGNSFTSRLGLDYYVSDKTTIGIGWTAISHPANQKSMVNSRFLNEANQLDSTIVANNHQDESFKNNNINLNYRHQYNQSGRELTIDVDYLNYDMGSQQSFLNNSYLRDGMLTNHELLTGDLPTNIKIYAAKADYSHPFKNGIKLSVGAKSNITLTDNEANYFYTVTGVKIPDYSKTNHFNYRENINAVYISANKEFKRLTVQAGLRMESTFSKGHQLGNIQKSDSTFNRNYTGLFPTLYLQYKLDTTGNNLIGMNYGRRIDRPYYQDLNPFISPIDKFTYYTGNPFLNPSYSNSLELSHTYKSKLTTTLSYSKTLDQVNETIEILDGIYYSRPGNIGQSVFKSLSVNGNFDLLPWFNVNLYGQVSNIHTTGSFYTGYIDTKGTFYYIKPQFQFKIKGDWIFQIDGYYQSKVTNAQFVAGDQKRVNAAISKKISASTSVKLVMNDVFHSYVNSGTINNLLQTQANYRNVLDTRTAILTLSYRFGKSISGQRKHDNNSTNSEQGRVKN
ncbi:outer membrane beta-barrel protein [Pedobacter sp. GR22-10]|uniref:outer membrane beta-barrel protein n=1 Tax=Pedobacter sp. GR22-10 TaxID=2994472 RepID=UPI002247A49F|nr:outer membrane beta-barrel protein [Pedobacter sp. GR22-10]MCX2430489.1 TonB-dependent receptor [Pedobacter sp. GR22-10]